MQGKCFLPILDKECTGKTLTELLQRGFGVGEGETGNEKKPVAGTGSSYPKHVPHKRRPKPKRHPKKPKTTSWTLEAEVLPGLAPFALAELRQKNIDAKQISDTDIHVTCASLPVDLRTVTALYSRLEFAIPRPKALLGNAELQVLVRGIERVREQNTFDSFRIDAAGSDSPVFQRLIAALESQLSLPHDPEDGDLLLRVRPSPDKQGWHVLVRTTPRPLSARAWRVCNLAGGLNACVAAAMLEVANVRPFERMMNAMCGSGTLLIEQASKQRVKDLWGVDVNEEALGCARANLQAAKRNIKLEHADVTALPYEDACVDVVVCDPPWGDALGSVENNRDLYPRFLTEMARVITPQGRLVMITHDIKRFERDLAASAWQKTAEVRVFHGGHYPRVYRLERP